MTATNQCLVVSAIIALMLSACSPQSPSSNLSDTSQLASNQSTQKTINSPINSQISSSMSSLSSDIPSDIPSDFASCSFNGQTYQHGDVVIGYQNSSVDFGSSCVSEERICNNGTFTGSYVYSSCQIAEPASCLFNGVTIAHGQSVNSFQNSTVAFGSTCQSEQRTCNNGQLSGSYAYATCSVTEAASCLFNGQTVAHGQSVNAFQNSTVAFGSTCTSEQRQCVNGLLSGSFQFASCNADQPRSCLFNGQTVAHGQSVNAFPTSSVSFGEFCLSEVRTCQDGLLSGSNTFATCNVNQPASCLFNGETIAHGQNVMAFATSTVSFGQTCQAEQRLCYNGSLDGEYEYASCNVSAPASCLINGLTVVHGQSTILYAEPSVNFGSTCQAESRTCENGALTGSYTHASCTVQPPVVTEPPVITEPPVVVEPPVVTEPPVVIEPPVVSEPPVVAEPPVVVTPPVIVVPPVVTEPKSCRFLFFKIPHGFTIYAAIGAAVKNHGGRCEAELTLCNNGRLILDARASCQNAAKPPKTPHHDGKDKDDKDKKECSIEDRVHSDNGKHLGWDKQGDHVDFGLHLGWYKKGQSCQPKQHPHKDQKNKKK